VLIESFIIRDCKFVLQSLGIK